MPVLREGPVFPPLPNLLSFLPGRLDSFRLSVAASTHRAPADAVFSHSRARAVTPSAIVSATEFTPQQMRAALQVLDALDRSENRLLSYYKHKRDHSRETYRKTVTISVPLDCFEHEQQIQEPPQFEVLVRNISRSGLSFIHPGELMFDHMRVGLAVSGALAWFDARVVRKRRVEEGFWEYGAAFTGRQNASES